MTKATRVIVEEWSGIDNALDFCTRHFGANGTQQGRRWFYKTVLPNDPNDPLSRMGRSHLGRKLRRRLGLPEHCYLYFRDAQDATLFCLMWPPVFDPK